MRALLRNFSMRRRLRLRFGLPTDDGSMVVGGSVLGGVTNRGQARATPHKEATKICTNIEQNTALGYMAI